MACALIKHEQIKTTLPKAKELRPDHREDGDQGEDGEGSLLRGVIAISADQGRGDSVTKLFDVLGPRYASASRRLCPCD